MKWLIDMILAATDMADLLFDLLMPLFTMCIMIGMMGFMAYVVYAAWVAK